MFRKLSISAAVLIAVTAAVVHGQSKNNRQVTITCHTAPDSVYVDPDTVEVYEDNKVHFGLGQPTCALVTVSGLSPISNFTLKGVGGPSDSTIVFKNLGAYPYTVSGAKGLTHGVILVVEPTPSLTEYGLIGLALILILSGVWIFWRKRALA